VATLSVCSHLTAIDGGHIVSLLSTVFCSRDEGLTTSRFSVCLICIIFLHWGKHFYRSDAIPVVVLSKHWRLDKGTIYCVLFADEYRHGALAVLCRCVNERLKIKVWTRNYRYVRGICVGYLVAFDKHWNLVCHSLHHTISLYSFRTVLCFWKKFFKCRHR